MVKSNPQPQVLRRIVSTSERRVLPKRKRRTRFPAPRRAADRRGIIIPNLKPGEVLRQRQGKEIERVAVLSAGEDHRCGPSDGIQRDINVFTAGRLDGESRAHDAEQLGRQPSCVGAIDFFGVLAPREALIEI
jgi:hypothetical protein